MTGVQITADNTEKLLDSMEDSANEFRLEKSEINDISDRLANNSCLAREETLQKLKKLEGRISLILHALHRKGVSPKYLY